MSGQPLVSVVIPFYNAGFLAESIESVLAQTYQHWELLLCDDGSVDGSSEVAGRFAAREPERIRVLQHAGHQNLGASAARNLGLSAASGEFIAFLDADDLWVPHKLADQIALFDQHPAADALCGSSMFWYSWTGDPADDARDYILRIGVPDGSVWAPPRFLARRLRGRAASPIPASLMVRRTAIERSGGFEGSVRTIYEDQVFYAKLFLVNSLLVVDTCWDRYRQHPDSSCASGDRAGTTHAAYVHYLSWVRTYLSERGTTNREVWSALRLAEWRVRHPTAAAVSRRVRHAYYDAARLIKRALGVRIGNSA